MILNNLLKVPKVNKMVLPLKNFLNNESKRNLNLLIKYLNHENDSRNLTKNHFVFFFIGFQL